MEPKADQKNGSTANTIAIIRELREWSQDVLRLNTEAMTEIHKKLNTIGDRVLVLEERGKPINKLFVAAAAAIPSIVALIILYLSTGK